MLLSLARDSPPEEKVKLNVNDFRSNTSRYIGAGGVLRDNNGDLLGVFPVNLHKWQVVDAEIWEFYFGLPFVNKSISSLCVEVDSAILVNLIKL